MPKYGNRTDTTLESLADRKGQAMQMTETAEALTANVETPRVVENPDLVAWTDEADLVVVGFGGAGVVAALEAVQSGASVLAVDRFAGGGATAMSGRRRLCRRHPPSAGSGLRRHRGGDVQVPVVRRRAGQGRDTLRRFLRVEQRQHRMAGTVRRPLRLDFLWGAHRLSAGWLFPLLHRNGEVPGGSRPVWPREATAPSARDLPGNDTSPH